MNQPESRSGNYVVAIDGPAASGKSTLARKLASRLGLLMVNSGAIYRAITWEIVRENINPEDSDAVISALEKIDIETGRNGGVSTIRINGVQPGDELRSEVVNSNVSAVSAIPKVREKVVQLLRDHLEHSSLVMEGRDIATIVFPDTPYKIYITAAEHVRAARRHKVGEVDSVKRRDAADSGRKTAPLKVADGAEILDTSDHTIESGVDAAIEILKRQGLDIH
ncbi:(d)CMP kinase [Luteolibacter pohnpeiensis]|uniref:Cytidylate kinase n=1 Tax=Luteolibacter pohnpeiensis TaxID=454153 RepID=A0A934SA52_9BACT|nr:(d)CMP kinase [Luteolibacter pohnpeiensis]MBK1882462.1 (d)CMP kinase [Luteolibacter pohnpeiensis]